MSYPTHSFTTASVAAGAKSQNNRTGLPSRMALLKIKVVPDTTTGTFDVKIFKSNTFGSSKLLAFWDNVDGSTNLYHPMDDSAGTAAEALEGSPIPYEDDDDSGQLHIEVTNNDTVAHTYTVTVTYLDALRPAVVGTQFDKTSDTTLANVTGLAVYVASAGVYTFEAVLFTTSNVAGGVKAAINGTATATAVIYEAIVEAAAAVAAQTRATSLGTAVGGVTAVTAALVRIRGTITVNAGGTLTVQFAQNASNGSASSVLVGSSFTVTRVS